MASCLFNTHTGRKIKNNAYSGCCTFHCNCLFPSTQHVGEMFPVIAWAARYSYSGKVYNNMKKQKSKQEKKKTMASDSL